MRKSHAFYIIMIFLIVAFIAFEQYLSLHSLGMYIGFGLAWIPFLLLIFGLLINSAAHGSRKSQVILISIIVAAALEVGLYAYGKYLESQGIIHPIELTLAAAGIIVGVMLFIGIIIFVEFD